MALGLQGLQGIGGLGSVGSFSTQPFGQSSMQPFSPAQTQGGLSYAPQNRVMPRPSSGGFMSDLGAIKQGLSLGKFGANLAGESDLASGLGAANQGLGYIGAANSLGNIASGHGTPGDYLSTGKTAYDLYNTYMGGQAAGGLGAAGAAGEAGAGAAAAGEAGAGAAAAGEAGAGTGAAVGGLGAAAGIAGIAAIPIMMNYMAGQEEKADMAKNNQNAAGIATAFGQHNINPMDVFNASYVKPDLSAQAAIDAYRNSGDVNTVNAFLGNFTDWRNSIGHTDYDKFRQYLSGHGGADLAADEGVSRTFGNWMRNAVPLEDTARQQGLQAYGSLSQNPILMAELDRVRQDNLRKQQEYLATLANSTTDGGGG